MMDSSARPHLVGEDSPPPPEGNQNIGLPIESSIEPSSATPTSQTQHRTFDPCIEERVRELETKLATLSRLLQTQNHSNRTRALSPSTRFSKAETPEKPMDSSDLSSSLIPHLESPTPTSNKIYIDDDEEEEDQQTNLPSSNYNGSKLKILQHPQFIKPTSAKRNLSFQLLYNSNNYEYERRNAPPTSSLTASERRWLGPMLLHNLPKQRQQPDDTVRNKWLNYLNSFQESTPDVDGQMEEFIQVPGKMESILLYGLIICIDSFLYMVTILPIRFVWSCFLLLLKLVWKNRPPHFQFHRQHTYQLIQVTILFVIYRYVLGVISIGKLYHWIRGQAMIKLYVLIAIVEVFDRLMCSLGQDCLDSMYWNTVHRPHSSRMLISVAVVLVYATLHTLILFVHAETLNVAMNSADQALLTLLISGNFAEIKSTVFKKYNKPALFKITASDICERFKLGLFLSLVLLLNLSQGMDSNQLLDYMRVCVYVWCTELLADSIKHSFITKFNFLSSSVYHEYALILAGDVTGIGHEGVNLDHSHAVVKRIGFAQIPLVCVCFRLLREAGKYAAMHSYWQGWPASAWWLLSAGLWLFMLAIKSTLGNALQRISMAKLRAAPEITQTPKDKKNK